MMKCLYRTRPYEKVPGSAEALMASWFDRIIANTENMKLSEFKRNIAQIVKEFDELPIHEDLKKPRVGIVGEILVKYHPNAFKEEYKYLLGSREMFLQYLSAKPFTDIQRAVQFYFLITRSFGGRGETFGTVKKSCGGASKSQRNVLDKIDAIHQRLTL